MVRDKERRYIMIKGTIQHEDVTLVNMYIPKTGAPKHAEQIFMDIKGERDRNAVIIGVNTPLTSMEWSSGQKINKETVALRDTLDQPDLTDIFRAFHPKAAEYIYFSSAHGTFFRTDHMLGHKTSLNKFKKIEIISSIFSGHNTMLLETNHKKILKNTQRHGS